MNLDEIVDYIEHFDEKGIDIAFLVTPGRCGSLLLQSLLDNHPQILQLPITYSFLRFCMTEYGLGSIEKLVEQFCGFAYMFPHGQMASLGPQADETVDLRIPEVKELVKTVLSRLSSINSRSCYLAFHLVHAQMFGIDMSKIKLIISHEHNIPGSGRPLKLHTTQQDEVKTAWRHYYSRPLAEYSLHGDPFLNAALRNFPNAHILATIRDPMALLYSNIHRLRTHSHHHPNDIFGYFEYSYQAIFMYYWLHVMKRPLGQRLHLVKFEEMHMDVTQTMQDLAKALQIDFSESMTETTFAGKIWTARFLSNRVKPSAGTGPEKLLKDQEWKSRWSQQTIKHWYTLTLPLYRYFNYEKPLINGQEAPYADWDSLKAMEPLEAAIYQNYPATLATSGPMNQLRERLNKASDQFEPFQTQWNNSMRHLPRTMTQWLKKWSLYPYVRRKWLIHMQDCITQLDAMQGQLVQ